jgi:hypothetical protein
VAGLIKHLLCLQLATHVQLAPTTHLGVLQGRVCTHRIASCREQVVTQPVQVHSHLQQQQQQQAPGLSSAAWGYRNLLAASTHTLYVLTCLCNVQCPQMPAEPVDVEKNRMNCKHSDCKPQPSVHATA